MKKIEKIPLLFEYAQASMDFNKARNRAFLSRIQKIMNLKDDDLLSFHDVGKF